MTSRYFAPLNIASTFALLPIGTAFFRAQTFSETRTIIRSMFDFVGPAGELMLTNGTIALAAIAFVITVLEERHRVIERVSLASPWIKVPAYALAFLALELFSVTEQRIPFVYFQF